MEMVVQREQERRHLDKTEGGGQKDGSAGIATCRWPPSTQTLDGTTQERRHRMQRRCVAAWVESIMKHSPEGRGSFSSLP